MLTYADVWDRHLIALKNEALKKVLSLLALLAQKYSLY